MIPFHNAMSIASGVSTGKTYEEWLAHVDTLTTNVAGWSSGVSFGKYKTTAAPVSSEEMRGSPWMNIFQGASSTAARMIQHALPSEAEFLAQIADARIIYFDTTTPASGSFVSLNRNGYNSLSIGTTTSKRNCVDCKFWTPFGVFSMDPFAGAGPTPYDWIIP